MQPTAHGSCHPRCIDHRPDTHAPGNCRCRIGSMPSKTFARYNNDRLTVRRPSNAPETAGTSCGRPIRADYPQLSTLNMG